MAKEYDCEHCEHWVKDYFGDRVCEFDGDCENPAPMTNEAWLKSLSTEELAELLNKIFMTRTFCHICPEGDVCDLGYECKYHGGKICDFMKWLKATHRG